MNFQIEHKQVETQDNSYAQCHLRLSWLAVALGVSCPMTCLLGQHSTTTSAVGELMASGNSSTKRCGRRFSASKGSGFKVLPWRWIVERTLASVDALSTVDHRL